jgi:hypothetical protein
METMKPKPFLIASILSLTIYVAPEAVGQPVPTDDSLLPAARNTVYLEGATALYVGGASINYERVLTRDYSIRTGLGTGYYADLGDNIPKTAFGTMVMLNYLTSGSDYHFEAGAGASLLYFKDGFSGGDYMARVSPGQWSVMPAVAIGYRYQQRNGGFFFRVGITYTYFMVTPIQVSFGHTF